MLLRSIFNDAWKAAEPAFLEKSKKARGALVGLVNACQEVLFSILARLFSSSEYC
jgi:hypothetical protein